MYVQLNLDLVPIDTPPAAVVSETLSVLADRLMAKHIGATPMTAAWIAETVLAIEQARVLLGEREP